MLDSKNVSTLCSTKKIQIAPECHTRPVAVWLAAGLCAIFSMSAQSATVYNQPGTALAGAQTVNSNAVTNPDGYDGDVAAVDNFSLGKAASISSVNWRGSSSNAGLAGFTVRIYASRHDPAAQPDLSALLGEAKVTGKADEKAAGNNLSDYHADFAQPVALAAGVQYWISVVSDRKDLSRWGWANGSGGDGKSLQSYAEFKILPAPNDRAFSLSDGGN